MWRPSTLPQADSRPTRWEAVGSSWYADDGVALLIVMTALMLVVGLASALALTALVETRIAAASRDDALTQSAAEAAAARILVDLRTTDWNAVLGGALS